MATFKITGPDGKQYNIKGETAEGAYSALQKHLAGPGASLDAAKPVTSLNEEGTGFSGDFTGQSLAIPMPEADPVTAALAPTAPKIPTGPEVTLAAPSIPTARPSTPAPLPSPTGPMGAAPTVDLGVPARPKPPPREVDMTMGAPGMMGGGSTTQAQWAAREIARQEAERTGGILAPDGNAAVTVKPGDPVTDAMTPAEPDPFAGEGAVALLKRRGSQFMQGLTEIGASIPEALAILSASGQQGRKEAIEGVIDQRSQIIADITARLADPALDDGTRAFLEQNLADLTRGQGVLATEAAEPVVPAKDRPLFKQGEAIRNKSGELFGVPDPRDTGFWGQLSQGAGSLVGFAASALVPGGAVAKLATGAALGAETNTSSLYREAINAGADEETAQDAAKWGMAIGASEIIPISRALKILPRGWGPKVTNAFFKKFIDIAASAGEEAAQEYVAQFLNNVTAQQLYDPERGWTEGATQAAVIGAVLGGGLGAVGSVVAGDQDAAKVPSKAPRGGDEPKGGPKVTPPPEDPMAAALMPAPEQGGPAGRASPLMLTPEQRAQEPLMLTPDSAVPDDVAAAMAPATAQPDVSGTPQRAPVEKKAAPPPEDPNFAVMDEVETVDGEERPTGRKVRVNLTTGDAEVVDEQISGAVVGQGDGNSGRGSAGKPQEDDGGARVGPNPASPPVATEQTPPPVAANRPTPSVETAPPLAPSQPQPGGQRGPVRKFLSHDETLAIQTDPKAFQYKGGSDTEGVTDALRNIKTFDPNRAGQVVLFERKDGTTVVADGHQRTGLARRAAAGGQADVGGTAATVYREADGYTADEVMQLAAIKNIGEGSGTAVDAARVLRNRTETIADLGLPPNSALVRKAEGLRRLDDTAFGMVANGVASEDHGDVVGRNVPDKALHADILALLTRANPPNLAQAAMIARDAASNASTETQTDMFGTLQVAKSLYVERAKVLDAALKDLGSQVKTFSTLIKKQDAITGAGNTLDNDANAALVDDASKVRQYLTSQANMKGPISDALTKAAELVRSGTPVARAAAGFVADAKRSLQGTGDGGQAPAGGGTPDEGRTPDQPDAVAPDASPDADLFGALTPTPTPPSANPAPDAGDDLFAALSPTPQTGKTPDQVRAEAEAKVKAAQSKAGTTVPQDAAGPLFDDQTDIEAAPPAQPDPIKRGRAILSRFTENGDEIYDKLSGPDLRDTPDGRALAIRFGKAKTAAEREAIADAWVLQRGRATGIEHMVMLTEDGAVLALMSGHKSGVSFHAAVWRAIEAGQVAYATHNHPSSSDFSGSDLTILAMGVQKIVAVGHNGTRHVATAVPGAMPKPERFKLVRGREVHDFVGYKEILEVMRAIVTGGMSRTTWTWDSYKAGVAKDPKYVPPEWQRANIIATSLVFDRMGMINYTGGTVGQIEAEGFNFGDIYEGASRAFADRLGRAGFVLTEKRDTGGNRPAESGTATASPDADPANQPPPQLPDEGDGGRVSPPVTDDFDTAATDVLDDLFGTDTPPAPAPKPAKRSDADIAKDLGGLFNEDPADFLSPLDRAKAKARKRPQQADLFDMLNSAQPGERQIDLEDYIEAKKAAGGDLFGFGEDIISQEKYAKAVPLFREILAGQDVTAQPVIDTIRAVAQRFKGQGLTRDGIERMLPYLKLYLADVQAGNLTNPVEDANAPGSDGNLEPDRGDAAPGDTVGAAAISPAGGRSGGGTGGRGGAVDSGGGLTGGNRLPDGGAAPVGTEGDTPVQGGIRGERGPAVGRDGAGGRDTGEQRPDPDSQPADHTGQYALDTTPSAVSDRAARQAEGDRIAKAQGVKWGNEANIRATLPLLMPAQQDDVVKIETRFAKPTGHGMLITNGTGTGKTYSGGGAIKRFVQAGKRNILIVAPSQGILDHWKGALADMGIEATALDSASTPGKGVVLTTYANMGMNLSLADRDWDLVVADEAHKLSQNAAGDATSALDTLRAITHHPDHLREKAMRRRRAEWDKARAMKDGDAKTQAMHRLFSLAKVEGEQLATQPRAKVLFLSATPFAYVKNTDYAEGYLFKYPKDGRINGSNQAGRNLFMVENFGYRIRYHKLTQPDANVDTGVFEREFHEKLKRDGVLSGRSLDIDADYDRRFVATEDAQGAQIDAVLQHIRDAAHGAEKGQRKDEYYALATSMKKTFDYLKRMQLLEAIKAKLVQADIDKHLAMGRKIVIFHDYNIGGGFKDRDRARAKASPYDQAKTHYFGRMKTSGRRDQREGLDFYPTPEPLAFKMVEWAGVRPYESVLEPSAGDGSIARYFPEHARRTIVEPSTDLLSRAELKAPGSRTVNTTFETYNVMNKHHAIIMNPPFGSGGKTAYDHLQKAMDHLKPGGRIVALVPTGPAADKRWEALGMGGYSVSTIILPSVTFEKAGTSVMSRIIILDKAPLRPDGKPDIDALRPLNAQSFYTDISNLTTIGGLFDRLENMTVGPRVLQSADPTDEADVEVDEEGNVTEVNPVPQLLPTKPGKALAPDRGAFTLSQTKHAKRGFDLFVASAANRVEPDIYQAMLAVAKRHNGWYSAFRGTGAIPGFQFKAEADRTAFLDDMQKPTTGGLEETAYHGTPHDFDRFTTDAMGTGEGAQVYGWGLYFASRREIAEFYKRTLSRARLSLDGEPINPALFGNGMSAESIAELKAMLDAKPMAMPSEVDTDDWPSAQVLAPYALRKNGAALRDKVSYDGDDPVRRLGIYRDVALNQYISAQGRGDPMRFEYAANLAVIDWLTPKVALVNPPRLYTVEVPDAENLLEWGAPITEHSPQVQEKLAPVLEAIRRYYTGSREKALNGGLDGFMRRLTGREVLDFLATSGATYGFEPSGFEFTKGGTGSVVMHQVRDEATGEVLGEADMRAKALEKAGIRPDQYAALALKKLGIPGHRFLDGNSRSQGEGTYNFVIYDDSTITVVAKEQHERNLSAEGAMLAFEAKNSVRNLAKAMPRLRAELDRLDLKRVNLSFDPTAEWQGMFTMETNGRMAIVVGAAMDPMATIHHEAIHVLYHSNLFTTQEWAALMKAAEGKWMAKYDIANRYPDLSYQEQLEEAIAEEFGESFAKRVAPKGSLLITAFNKIIRILKATRNVLRGLGFQTAEDIFGKVMAGEISRRVGGRGGVQASWLQEPAQRKQVERKTVATLTGTELGDWSDIRQLGRKAEAWYRDNLVGTSVTNAGTGWPIKFNAVGAKKLGSGKGPDLLRLVPALREVLENGTIIGSEPDRRGRPQIKAIHKVSARVMLNGAPKDVIATIRETNEGNFHYDLGRDMSDGARFTPPAEGEAAVRMDDAQVRSPALEGNSVDINLEQNRPEIKPPTGRFQKARLPSAQARAHMATAMGGQHLHVPDRAIWDELTRAGAPVWQRLRNGAGAARDAADRARMIIQDRMLPIRRAQEAIVARRGKPLPSGMDVYGVETTFSGKVGRHLFEIDEGFTKPIIDLIAKSKGLTADSVGQWLYARHAIERNARIASINPRMPDGGSGMMDADAQQILAQAVASPHAAALNQIGALVDQLREQTLKMREDAGLITHADPIFQGLAISLLFELKTSTLLTVLVIPAIFRVFRTRRNKGPGPVGGRIGSTLRVGGKDGRCRRVGAGLGGASIPFHLLRPCRNTSCGCAPKASCAPPGTAST